MIPQLTMHEPVANAGTLPKGTEFSRSVSLFLLGVGYIGAFLLAQMVKNFPTMQEIRVWSGRSPGEGSGYSLQYSLPGETH